MNDSFCAPAPVGVQYLHRHIQSQYYCIVHTIYNTVYTVIHLRDAEVLLYCLAHAETECRKSFRKITNFEFSLPIFLDKNSIYFYKKYIPTNCVHVVVLANRTGISNGNVDSPQRGSIILCHRFVGCCIGANYDFASNSTICAIHKYVQLQCFARSIRADL